MQWNGEADGLRSGRIGIAYTKDVLQIVDSTQDAFTIELAVRSMSSQKDHIGRVLSIMGPDKAERFFVGQWQDRLLVRFYGAQFDKGFLELNDDFVFAGGKPTHVIVSYRHGAVSLFVNGVTVIASSPLPLHSLNGILILGNAPAGNKGWIGELDALCLSRKPMTSEEVSINWQYWLKFGALKTESAPAQTIAQYAFTERSGHIAHNMQGPEYALFIPENMEKKDFQMLHLPFDEFGLTKGYLLDVALNSLGFIPFGFCFALFLLSFERMSHKCLLFWTTGTGGLISLTIEVLQALMLSRSSQLSDLILNTLGTLGGAVFCLLPLLLYRKKEQNVEESIL